MTNITIGFDETVLAKAVVDQTVAAVEAAINNAFHNVFPRLRRDEIEAATQPLVGCANIYTDGKATLENAEAPTHPDKPGRQITPNYLPPSSYVIKTKTPKIKFPPIGPGGMVLPEGFYFVESEEFGSNSFTPYSILETNNA